MKTIKFPSRTVLAALLALALAGCAADRMHSEGLSLIDEGKLEEGLSKLEQAKQADPGNANFKKDWILQRDALTARLLRDAEKERSEQRWDAALQRYARVLTLDRGNIAARQASNDITAERRQSARVDDAALQYGKGDLDAASNTIARVLVENPSHVRALALRSQIIQATAQNSLLNGAALNLKGKKPVTLQFRDANLRMVMEAIAKTTGLNVMFDKDVKTDLKVTIFVRDTPVEEAIDLILMQTQTAKRILSENSILIYADTEAKSREYAELKIRRFAMTNADPKNVMAMVKTMTKTKDIFIDEKTNSLVVRDTPQIIRMIEKLIVAMDQPEPEVMLEVDVMEVSRDRALALGIDLPTTFGTSLTSMTLDQLAALGRGDFVSTTGVTVTAKKTDSDVNTLATPRIRVRNKEKAKFLVGDRLPVISTAAVPGSTATTGVGAVYNTSVQYVEVGIKIEAEPTIYADGEVAIRMALEVSSAGAPNADAAKTGTIAYTIGTRSVNTVLRLKDGQTEVIGGLIQDEDTSAATRVPGLGDIPILGRLFGKQTDVKNKKEIIMSITPRIIRNNRQVDSDLLEMWSGTENNMRFGNRQASSSSASSASSAAAAPAVAAPAAAPAPTGSRLARPAVPAPAPVPAPVNLLAPVPMLAPAAEPAADTAVPEQDPKPAQ
ncbi:secretin N-terminal domain-containing protein [Rhodoferax lacus]|uniref:secretin N-terminal domain-containing protein n=1 Tax=Rhodoferax lacus TaxID=2184758 RepID=UPI0011C19C3B|nr:secretin N-terminal domain-containing protein [Rhodoferax lacus]